MSNESAVWTGGQATQLLVMAGQKGLTKDAADAITQGGHLADLYEAAVAGTLPDREKLRELLGLGPLELAILVNYGMSLGDMIRAGEYDWTDPDITPANFPITGTGTKKLFAELIHFNLDIFLDDAEAELKRMKRRPGKIEELLAFGATFPCTQRKFPIIALGSSARIRGDRYVPYLGGDDSERRLNLRRRGGGWIARYRFLAFPEE